MGKNGFPVLRAHARDNLLSRPENFCACAESNFFKDNSKGKTIENMMKQIKTNALVPHLWSSDVWLRVIETKR